MIMAAHGTPRFILEAIESVERQDPLSGWRWELRLGVDGCPNVRAILDRRRRGYYWSSKNVGAYVMRNSLIALSPADCYAIFDSDDVMYPAYLRTLAPYTERGMIAGSARVNTRVDLKPQDRREYRAGVCVIPHEVWEKLGGYRPERVGGDVDLIDRAKKLGVEIHRHWPALYLRRKRRGQLTQGRSYGIRSRYRTETRQRHVQAVRKGRLHVRGRTVELERVQPGGVS